MSVLSLSYLESDVYWRQSNKHFAELAPQNGRKQLIWRNYVTVTLCIAGAKMAIVRVVNIAVLLLLLILIVTVSYRRQGGYVIIVVCLSVKNIAHKIPNGFAWNFREGWQWANEQIIKFAGGGCYLDLYRDTGKTCLGRGVHSPSASGFNCSTFVLKYCK